MWTTHQWSPVTMGPPVTPTVRKNNSGKKKIGRKMKEKRSLDAIREDNFAVRKLFQETSEVNEDKDKDKDRLLIALQAAEQYRIKLFIDKDKRIADLEAAVEFQKRETLGLKESNATQLKEVNEENEKLLSDKDKLIADLKAGFSIHLKAAVVEFQKRETLIVNLQAAVVQFQNREERRMEESTAAQNLLKQQSNLIKSLQQLSGRQVIKKVKHYSLYYSVKQACYGSSLAGI